MSERTNPNEFDWLEKSPKNIKKWVVEIVRDSFCGGGNPLQVGRMYRHPKTGRPLLVTGGGFWGTYGVSNHFDWKYLDNDATDYGYGWFVDNDGNPIGFYLPKEYE